MASGISGVDCIQTTSIIMPGNGKVIARMKVDGSGVLAMVFRFMLMLDMGRTFSL